MLWASIPQQQRAAHSTDNLTARNAILYANRELAESQFLCNAVGLDNASDRIQ